jgi:hypothetical protein
MAGRGSISRKALRVKVSVAAVVTTERVVSSWQTQGEPERFETTYKYRVESPHILLQIDSMGGFPSHSAALKAGKTALKETSENFSRVDLANYL